MTQSVKVPDPVHEKARERAEELDSTMGEVIRRWMEDSHRLREETA
jgi:hypothetical protein